MGNFSLFEIMRAVNATNDLKYIEPQNETAKFCNDSFIKLFPGNVPGIEIIKNIIVSAANKEPEEAKKRMKIFNEEYQAWPGK